MDTTSKYTPYMRKQSALCRFLTLAVSALIMPVVTMFAQVNVRQVVSIGQNAMYFDDYVVAIHYFNQAIAAKPYVAQPYFYRSVAKLNLEDYHGAAVDAGKAVELNEFIADAWEVRAVARQNMGDAAGAISDYEHALTLKPRNRQLMSNLAFAYAHEGNLVKADSVFTQVIAEFPGYETAWLGRAQTHLERGDTLSAIADIDTALVRNPDSFNGHTMRAEVLMHRERPLLRSALESIDKAIKLEPRLIGLYINRAYVRYCLNDWYGAKEDYDYALTLDPLNKMAYFNRGVLNAEANANDDAYVDFSAVIRLDPGDYRAYFNRALIQTRRNNLAGAISDMTKVLSALPNFSTGYLMRGQYEYDRGNMAAAQRDFEKAVSIAGKKKKRNGSIDFPQLPDINNKKQKAEPTEKELVEKEFSQLLTVNDNVDLRREYNNSAMRGRIQDRNVTVEWEPMVELSYYTSATEVNDNTFFIKDVDEINKTRQLHNIVFATVNPPQLFDENEINNHFSSIEYYNSYVVTHTPRTIDYVGRAMDFITVRDYESAIRDIDRAIALNPDFAPAYMLRAQAKYRLHKIDFVGFPDEDQTRQGVRRDAIAKQAQERKISDDILSDLDKALQLTPNNAVLYYNRGVALLEFNRIDEAAQAFNRAIDLKPDFAQAYFNRGYVQLKNGNKVAGIEDLSRAGELGIISAYNVIKRISSGINQPNI